MQTDGQCFSLFLYGGGVGAVSVQEGCGRGLSLGLPQFQAGVSQRQRFTRLTVTVSCLFGLLKGHLLRLQLLCVVGGGSIQIDSIRVRVIKTVFFSCFLIVY